MTFIYVTIVLDVLGFGILIPVLAPLVLPRPLRLRRGRPAPAAPRRGVRHGRGRVGGRVHHGPRPRRPPRRHPPPPAVLGRRRDVLRERGVRDPRPPGVPPSGDPEA